MIKRTMKRIQRKRTKGWRMPKNTIYVGRPTKFGNPFKVENGRLLSFNVNLKKWVSYPGIYDETAAVVMYERWIKKQEYSTGLPTAPDYSVLKGKNLACFCSPNKPCHADILLKLANK